MLHLTLWTKKVSNYLKNGTTMSRTRVRLGSRGPFKNKLELCTSFPMHQLSCGEDEKEKPAKIITAGDVKPISYTVVG